MVSPGFGGLIQGQIFPNPEFVYGSFLFYTFFLKNDSHFSQAAVEPLDETAPLAFERVCAELITAGSPGVSRFGMGMDVDVDEKNFLRNIGLMEVSV